MTPAELAALHAVAMRLPRPWSATEFADLLTLPGVFLVTVPHGFALGRAVAGEAELLTLAVDPAHRRKGLGARALAAFEAEARARDAVEAHLEVAADNAAARALYARAGWAETGCRPRYYRVTEGGAVDAVLMHRHLGAG